MTRFVPSLALIAATLPVLDLAKLASKHPDNSSHIRVTGKKNVAEAASSIMVRFNSNDASKIVVPILMMLTLYLNPNQTTTGQKI